MNSIDLFFEDKNKGEDAQSDYISIKESLPPQDGILCRFWHIYFGEYKEDVPGLIINQHIDYDIRLYGYSLITHWKYVKE